MKHKAACTHRKGVRWPRSSARDELAEGLHAMRLCRSPGRSPRSLSRADGRQLEPVAPRQAENAIESGGKQP